MPAVMDYVPYRKGDGTAPRDAPRFAHVAGHGYAGMRVDIRGSGESGGLLPDEYLPREQQDMVEVLAWLEDQPWCTGSAGMIGISWGGTGPGCGRRRSRSRSRCTPPPAGWCCRCARRVPRTPSCPVRRARERARARDRDDRPRSGRAHARARLHERHVRDHVRLGHGRPLPAGGSGHRDGLLGASTAYSIVPGDPLSAKVTCRAATEFGRDGLSTRAEARGVMDADAHSFRIRTELEAWQDGERVLLREWDFDTPRELG